MEKRLDAVLAAPNLAGPLLPKPLSCSRAPCAFAGGGCCEGVRT